MKAPRKNDSLTLLDTIVRENLLPQMIAQINKDAALSGLDLEMDQDLDPSQIVHFMAEKLRRLMQRDFDAYLNFLYRVDIPEKRMLIHEGQEMDELVEQATLQVLIREWEKVWFKNKNR